MLNPEAVTSISLVTVHGEGITHKLRLGCILVMGHGEFDVSTCRHIRTQVHQTINNETRKFYILRAGPKHDRVPQMMCHERSCHKHLHIICAFVHHTAFQSTDSVHVSNEMPRPPLFISSCPCLRALPSFAGAQSLLPACDLFGITPRANSSVVRAPPPPAIFCRVRIVVIAISAASRVVRGVVAAVRITKTSCAVWI